MRRPGRELASLTVVVVAADRVVYEGCFGSRWFGPAGQERTLPVNAGDKVPRCVHLQADDQPGLYAVDGAGLVGLMTT